MNQIETKKKQTDIDLNYRGACIPNGGSLFFLENKRCEKIGECLGITSREDGWDIIDILEAIIQKVKQEG